MNTLISLIICIFLIYVFLYVTRLGRLILLFGRTFGKFILLLCLFVKLLYKSNNKLIKKVKAKTNSKKYIPKNTNVIYFNKYQSKAK